MATALKAAWTGALASARREWQFLRRSPWDLAQTTLLPWALLTLVALIFSAGPMRGVPIAVVDEDHSAASRELVRQLDAAAGLRVAAQPASLDHAWALVRRLDVYAVLHVPRDAMRQIQRGDAAQLTVYYNASFLATGQSAAREVTSVTQTAGATALPLPAAAHAAGQARPVRVQANLMFNAERSYEHFLVALLFPALLLLCFCVAAVGALGRELRDGSGPAWLAASGARPLAALLGKLLPYLALFSVYGALASLWVAHVKGGQVAGSPALLLVGQVCLYLAYAGVALLLVGATRNLGTALSATGIYVSVAFSFSGGAFPTLGGSGFTRVWSQLMPFTAYVDFQARQLDLGTPWTDSLGPLGTLLLFAAATGIPGVWLYLRALRDPASWGRR